VLGDGSPLVVQLTRMESELLELKAKEIVYARPRGSAASPGSRFLRQPQNLLR
jgi:hypothetical protein